MKYLQQKFAVIGEGGKAQQKFREGYERIGHGQAGEEIMRPHDAGWLPADLLAVPWVLVLPSLIGSWIEKLRRRRP